MIVEAGISSIELLDTHPRLSQFCGVTLVCSLPRFAVYIPGQVIIVRGVYHSLKPGSGPGCPFPFLCPFIDLRTPAAPYLWNDLGKGKFRPKDEFHFSDYVKRYLDRELKPRCVVHREVEIRPGEGSGQDEITDILVTAGVGESDLVKVIIEVKGCWHEGLKSAMKMQLTDRYLRDNQCQHGIYIVGWFMRDQWDRADRRFKQTPGWSTEDAQDFFTTQASGLSKGGVSIKALVINAALR